jgi:nitroreductase
MEFSKVVEARRSVKLFDTSYDVDDATLGKLFDSVVLSPSSFNLQHWRFVVVRDAENKKALRSVAYDQPQVTDAAVVVVVCANLLAHRDAERIHADAPDDVRSKMVPMINGFYEGKDRMQRDEAIRSASLAAMTLMLAATDMGLATGPMIGFDPDGVSKAIGLDDAHLPVMLIVLGKQTGDIRPRASRLGLDEVVKLERFDGAGLD